MRIIAGDYKGRRLQSPQDYSIRPTTDKVKEALFSILTEKIWGSRVLDLFAGTGNLGIEALSRGAETCVFADSSRESLRLIRENIAHCKAEEGARVEAVFILDHQIHSSPYQKSTSFFQIPDRGTCPSVFIVSREKEQQILQSMDI